MAGQYSQRWTLVLGWVMWFLALQNTLAFDYAVVLDCGSKGTRLYVYRRGTGKHEKGIVQLGNGRPLRKVVPGLASFAPNPQSAVRCELSSSIHLFLSFWFMVLPRLRLACLVGRCSLTLARHVHVYQITSPLPLSPSVSLSHLKKNRCSTSFRSCSSRQK